MLFGKRLNERKKDWLAGNGLQMLSENVIHKLHNVLLGLGLSRRESNNINEAVSRHCDRRLEILEIFLDL